MKILVSGSYGMVGTALVPALEKAGHSVTRLVRVNGQPGILWNPESGLLTSTPFEGFDAVIHLGGESIAQGRWTEEKKKRIRESRVRSTRMLADVLSRTQKPPATFICASAIGIYGSRGAEVLKESSAAGSDYLAEVCKAWEASTGAASQKGIRVINLRFGIILSGEGGALKKMLLPFKLGLGGKIGSGAQFMSWISLPDVVSVILHALNTPSLKGPVNAVAPRAVTNLEYTKALGKVLGRPTIFPMPAIVAKLAFGEMADALLLASQRVDPAALTQSGFKYRDSDLEGTFHRLLHR